MYHPVLVEQELERRAGAVSGRESTDVGVPLLTCRSGAYTLNNFYCTVSLLEDKHPRWQAN